VRNKIVSGPRAVELISGFTQMARLRIERSLRDDRRAAPRWPLRQPMRLHTDVRAYEVVSADISQCGVGVYCTVLDLADTALYAIELSPQSVTPALLRARVVRREPEVGGVALYGLAFVVDVADVPA
jgi:hypothetical protein